MKIHHFGFVVSDIVSIMNFFCLSYVQWNGHIYDDILQKVRVTFLLYPGGILLELVQPNVEDSPVSRFLKEKGGGFHHICYEVDDLEDVMKSMGSMGYIIAKRPKPAVAFNGRRIGWMLTPEKKLIELLECKYEKE
jgi:methylmalonyl-CoA/ethylmalonyl-CoA epimerase